VVQGGCLVIFLILTFGVLALMAACRLGFEPARDAMGWILRSEQPWCMDKPGHHRHHRHYVYALASEETGRSDVGRKRKKSRYIQK
jgi:hypothetical protein